VTHPDSARHLSDGDIVALIDGERRLSAGADERHLAQCDVCRERRNRFSEYSSDIREDLSSVSIPIVDESAFRARVAEGLKHSRPRGSARRYPAWSAAAAAIVLATAAAAATSPARDWLRSLFDSRRVTQSAPAQPPIPRPAAPELSGSSVSFAATGAVFTVRLDATPLSGGLVARPAKDDNITATVVSGAGTGGDALVVLPGELRIRNTSAARASYRLDLPRTITRLRLIIADRVAYDGSPSTSIDLVPRR